MKTIVITGFLLFGIQFGQCKDANADPISSQKIQNWVSEHIHYPELAKVNKEEGTVYVEFTVDQGKVENSKIIGHSTTILDEAALEMIQSLPSFLLPSIQKNTYIIPIKFDLI